MLMPERTLDKSWLDHIAGWVPRADDKYKNETPGSWKRGLAPNGTFAGKMGEVAFYLLMVENGLGDFPEPDFSYQTDSGFDFEYNGWKIDIKTVMSQHHPMMVRWVQENGLPAQRNYDVVVSCFADCSTGLTRVRGWSSKAELEASRLERALAGNGHLNKVKSVLEMHPILPGKVVKGA